MATELENTFFPFLSRDNPTTHRTPRLPADQWTKHRRIIKDLYVHQDKTLNELVATMKQEYGFHATYGTLHPR
jgi:hypothetical protein